ncbi:TIR domain-containing protein [Streptomyces sp. Act143]|uniref:TIR domain-containing protein n=1 Tax=Streptomyces sp. Act143 TaxID=2200760 RepID=UPI0015E7ED8E|nr:TIR domain-containing protein [Streptomyces sp. Act143]
MNGAAVEYEFDVFVSYSRSAGNVCEWVWNHFYPALKRCLEDEIGKAEIFIDRQLDEHIGKPWPDQLATSLGRSKLLVPVLSAPYFRSPWCRAEWATMEKREEQANNNGLIFPVVFADGTSFPDEVQRRQLHKQFKNYNVPYPKYVESEAYPHFHREVQSLAELIAVRLTEVPEWSPDWPALRPPLPDTPLRGRLPRFGA